MTRGIQESDVWEAADALLVAGERPKIERVRQKIGLDSPNTVSPILDTWFKHLGIRLAGSCSDAAGREVPELSAQGEAKKVSMARLERALVECQPLLMVKDEEHGLLLKQLVASVGSAGKSTRKRASKTRNV